MSAICCFEHHVARTGVFIPAAIGLQVHRTQLPLTKRILHARLEPSLLLLLSHFHPVLNENDSSINNVLFHLRTELEEASMLLFRTKSHHVLHSGAVIPTAVEDHDFSCGGKVRHV